MVIGVFGAVVLAVGIGGSFRPACSVCHSAQSVALAETAHTGVTCYQCHLDNGAWSLPSQKANELLRMYPKAWLARVTEAR